MKKSIKISKKTTNILLILFLTIVSSLFFTSNAKAFSNDDIYYFYYQDNIKEIINSDNFKNALENIKNEIELKSGYYKNYLIDFHKNASALYLRYFYFNDDDVELEYNCELNSRYPNECFSKIKYNFSNINYIRYNLVDMSVFSSTYNSAQIGNSYQISQTFDDMNFINRHLIHNLYFIYDANINITSNFKFKDKNNKLLNYIPKVLKNEPTIDFTYKNNITTINDTNYVISKDVTTILNNYDSKKHLFQYQFVKSDELIDDNNWITHAFANNKNSLTLNFEENGYIVTRILDIENNYNIIYTNIFTFDDIYYVDEQPTIDFTYKNKTIVVNDVSRVISKDLIISLNNYDRYKHIFQYQIVKEGSTLTKDWITYTFYNNHILTLNINENCTIYTRILDKENNVISNNTFMIDDIYNTLSLKKNFNSSDGYSKDLYSLNIINYNYNSLNYNIPFRIQFGSNDFSNNYPFVSSIRGYYYNTITQEKKYDENVIIKDFSCEKTMSWETICEGVMTKKLNKPTYYEIIFSNTDNYYLYYYDYFDNNYRNVDVTTDLFKDYNKYYFDSNSNIAFISPKNINNTNKKGSLIIPYYYLNNDELNVKLRKFKISDNTFLSEYSSYFLDDLYYKKFDFEIEDNYLPVLTNKKGSYCNTFYANSNDIFDIALNYDGYFLNFNNNKLYTIFDITSLSLYNKETICYKEEPVYFYLHKDFKITFNVMNSDNNIVITDDEGNNIADIDSGVNSENLYSSDKSFFDSVGESFNYFSAPFREIFNMISYFWNLLPIALKLLFIFIFVILISLFIFKFIL